jgi:hypothetical protein
MDNVDKNNLKVSKVKLEAMEIPTIKEHRNKDFVPFGIDNLFPQKIIDLYNKSAIHHTAVDAIIMNIIGQGLDTVGSDIINLNQETLNDIYEKVAGDMVMFRGFSLNVIWNKEGTRIVELYHLPFNNVRSGKYNEEEEIDSYFYCPDWNAVRKVPPKPYRAFSTTDNKKENASQIYYYYVYSPGNEYYPLPEYVGAVNDIELDARISRFHNANISNGLAPSMFIKFRNGIPTPDERDSVYKEINNTFSGEQNAGRFFLSFSDADNAMEVDTIDNANDDYYVILDERITSRILTAHKITSPLLLGIKDKNGFSSNADEIDTAYRHFEGTVITPKRKKILNALKPILKSMGINVELSVIPNNPIVVKTTETK